jgi:hypothetical protein
LEHEESLQNEFTENGGKRISKVQVNFDLVGVEVRWDKGATEQATNYTIIYGNGNENRQLGT